MQEYSIGIELPTSNYIAFSIGPSTVKPLYYLSSLFPQSQNFLSNLPRYPRSISRRLVHIPVSCISGSGDEEAVFKFPLRSPAQISVGESTSRCSHFGHVTVIAVTDSRRVGVNVVRMSLSCHYPTARCTVFFEKGYSLGRFSNQSVYDFRPQSEVFNN